MGEAMGRVVQQFWDPEWFQALCKTKAKKGDVFCLRGGTISTENETEDTKLIGQMSEQNKAKAERIKQEEHAKADRRKMTAEYAECNRLDAKEIDGANMKRISKKHVGEQREHSTRKVHKDYARATQNERMKFRRRVKSIIENKRNLNEVEWDVDIEKTAADGAVGIWEGAEIYRNESSGLVDHEFA